MDELPAKPATQTSKTLKLIGNRYQVIRPLGRGGMGKVFLVLDEQTGQQLALKMIRTQYQYNGKAVARFDREVAAIRKLDHPCIVKIFDARKDGDLLYYTMEYVGGKSLRLWMQEKGKFGLGSAVRILGLISHALEHAHKVTIHRDISPENVMVMKDGSLRLLDFGLAKLTGEEQALTQVGISLGKLLYIAPEQRASAADVDQRADIYPLGVMFYEMLTGQLPKGMKLRELRPDLPVECETFLARAMADHPDDRFSTAAEFHRALLKMFEAAKDKPAPESPATMVKTVKTGIPAATSPSAIHPPVQRKPLSWLERLIRLFRRERVRG